MESLDTCDRVVGSHPWLVSLVARWATEPLFAVRASHRALSRGARVRLVLRDQLRDRAEVEAVVEVPRRPEAHKPGYLS